MRSLKNRPKNPRPSRLSSLNRPKLHPLSSEDYLNWGKAAYQNIQARQTEAPAETADSDETIDSADVAAGDRSSSAAALEPEEAAEALPAVSAEASTREVPDETPAPAAALEISEDDADVDPETVEQRL